MNDPLFRPEALEHRRDVGLGVVVQRRRWRVGGMLALCGACVLALACWLARWELAPGHSLFGWVVARVTAPSGPPR